MDADLADRVQRTILASALGREIAYRPAVGGEQLVRGVFGRPHELLPVGDGVEVTSDRPAVMIRIADLDAEPARDDQILISGTLYRVAEVREDGYGAAELLLDEV